MDSRRECGHRRHNGDHVGGTSSPPRRTSSASCRAGGDGDQPCGGMAWRHDRDITGRASRLHRVDFGTNPATSYDRPGDADHSQEPARSGRQGRRDSDRSWRYVRHFLGRRVHHLGVTAYIAESPGMYGAATKSRSRDVQRVGHSTGVPQLALNAGAARWPIIPAAAAPGR